eukprot:5766107-Karenia_brevis.AAC.1
MDKEDVEMAGEKPSVVAWINISGKRGFRRLHRWGGCSRRPTADRQSFELYNTVPGPSDYHDFCRACWRK